MQKAIAYYRLSTDKQEQSGLGIEAQKKAVADFVKYNRYKLIDYFTDIDSGRNNERPALLSALKECKEQNAVLVIAALDRLSRSVSFISQLLETDAEFKIVNHPEADHFMIHLLAAFAQKEREDISKRTIAALAAAKRRGIKLGSYGKNVLSKLNKTAADRFAKKMRPLVKALQGKGITSIRAIADALNKLKVPTYRKHQWFPTTVQNLLKRLSKLR